MQIRRTNTWSRITVEGEERERVSEALGRRFAYPVEGVEFVPSYQEHRWDGKVRLCRKIKGGIVYPSGLHDEVVEVLENGGFEFTIEDARWAPPQAPRTAWGSYPLREYQIDAVAAALAASGGILRMPIRSGKTLMAAAIIKARRTTAAFVVPADLLLRQTVEAFTVALPGLRVTAVGSGNDDDSGDVVVCSVQSLAARKGTPWWRTFCRRFGVVFFDEAHQFDDGEVWRDVGLGFDAFWKYALSATMKVSRKEQNSSSAIWIRGICGPVLASLTMTQLIDCDPPVLVRPTIRFVRHQAPRHKGARWSPALQKSLVTECKERNDRLAAEAIAYAKAGHRVLVDVSRVGHGRALADLIKRGLRPGQVAVLMGSAPGDTRERVLKALRAGTILVVVGTILGYGVDLPELEVVINAEGGKSWVSTVQRMRNLTPCPSLPGKIAIVVEPIDDHHRNLAEHTAARLKTYREEPAFVVEVEPAPPGERATTGRGRVWWK